MRITELTMTKRSTGIEQAYENQKAKQTPESQNRLEAHIVDRFESWGV